MKRFFAVLAVASILAAPVASATAFEKTPMVLLGDVGSEAPVVAPAPTVGSMLGDFAKQFLTPTGIASAVVTILGLVGGALGLTALRKRQIAIVTNAAFHGVEDFAATTETDIDDKVAVGLRIANEWMVAHGWRTLKPGEEAIVKLGFKALNGAEQVAAKIAEAGNTTVNLLPPGSKAPTDVPPSA